MYDIDNGILIKSQDKAGNIKSQEILAKLNKLNVYSNSLHKTIKKDLLGVDSKKKWNSRYLRSLENINI